MEIMEEDQLLSLSLAIVTHTDHHHHHHSKTSDESIEENIFRVIKIREQMLNEVVLQSAERKGLELIHLLLFSATSIEEKDLNSALGTLFDLYRNVSIMGDSSQRVAAYFADGLMARILTQRSRFYHMIMKKRTPKEKFLAFTNLYRVSAFYQFAHFTANQAILESFEREEGSNNGFIHVIDFDVSYGFQWPSLIQSLSQKAANGSSQISLLITGFGRNMEELIETENRLMSFSKGFHNIKFEFKKLMKGEELELNQMKKRNKNETVAVNLVLHLCTLNRELEISHTLNLIHSLNPSILMLVEREGSTNKNKSSCFISGFMDSLHYYASMFDSLDDCLPLESTDRLSIERDHLGEEIKHLITNDHKDLNFMGFESTEEWKKRMEKHGFSGMKMSSRTTMQAKLLMRMGCHYHPQFEGDSVFGGFRVFERDNGRDLSLGWQDKLLITASAWCCV